MNWPLHVFLVVSGLRCFCLTPSPPPFPKAFDEMELQGDPRTEGVRACRLACYSSLLCTIWQYYIGKGGRRFWASLWRFCWRFWKLCPVLLKRLSDCFAEMSFFERCLRGSVVAMELRMFSVDFRHRAAAASRARRKNAPRLLGGGANHVESPVARQVDSVRSASGRRWR